MTRRPPTRDEILAKHPRFRAAVVADARLACACRGERPDFRGPLDTLAQVARLMCVTDGFLGQVLYRAQARLQARRVPLLPRLAHHLAMATAQVCIGDLVVMQPGVYLTHGQVVIGSVVEIRRGAVIGPTVTIGIRNGNWDGPKIGAGAQIGAGAKLIGPVRVGDGACVDPNTVVVADVPAHATVTGIPGRVLERDRPV
jgi:serine O-acetyltransferase